MEQKILGLTDEELQQVKEDLDVDEIEDFDLVKNKIVYEVWILGYDAEMNATDFEVLVDDGYTEEAEAQKCFEYIADIDNIAKFLEKIEVPIPTKHLHLMLEQCIVTDDGGTECQDIVDEIALF